MNLAARPDEGETEEEIERSECGDEGWNPDERDQQTVYQPKYRTDEQCEPDGTPHGPVRECSSHGNGADSDDTAHGEIQQSTRDEQRHPTRCESDERGLEQDVGDVAGAPEDRLGGTHRDRQDDEDGDQVLTRDERQDLIPPARRIAGVDMGALTILDVFGLHHLDPFIMRETAARWAPSTLSAKISRTPRATYW